MPETDNTVAVEQYIAPKQRLSQKELGSIRGAFTLTLLSLQERLSYIPDAETKLVVPVVDKLDWDTSNSFWYGTIIDKIDNKPLYSSQSPQLAMTRIILNMVVHPDRYNLDHKLHKQIELDFTDVLKLIKVACSSSLTFTVEELIYLRSRLDSFSAATFPVKLSPTEQVIVRSFLATIGANLAV